MHTVLTRILPIAVVIVMTVAVASLFIARKVIAPRVQAEAAASLTLGWDVLLPEEALVAYEALATAPEDDNALLIAQTSTVAALDGQTLSISGFMVPLDNQRSTTQQFLLVPFQGACIHTPAPPPNQVISVYAEKAAKRFHNWQPITITGTISVAGDSTELAEAGYVMMLDRVAPFRAAAEEEGETRFTTAPGAHDSPLL